MPSTDAPDNGIRASWVQAFCAQLRDCYEDRVTRLSKEFKRLLLEPYMVEVLQTLQRDDASQPFIQEGLNEAVEKVLRSEQEALIVELQRKLFRRKTQVHALKKEVQRLSELLPPASPGGPAPRDLAEAVANASKEVIEKERQQLMDICNSVGAKVVTLTSYEQAHQRLVRTLQAELESVKRECQRLQQQAEQPPEAQRHARSVDNKCQHCSSAQTEDAKNFHGSITRWQQQMQQEHQHYVETLSKYSAVIDELQDKCKELEVTNLRLNAELHACNPLADRIKIQLQEASQELQRLQNENGRLTSDVARHCAERDAALTTQQQLETKVQQLQAEAAEETRKTQADLQRLSRECSEQALHFENAKKQKEQLEQELSQTKSEVQTLTQQFGMQVQELCGRLRAAEADHSRWDEAEQSFKSQMAHLEQQVSEARDQACSQQRYAEEAQAKVQLLQKELQQATSEVQRKQEELQQMEIQNAALYCKALDEHTAYENVEKALAEANTNQEALKKEIEALRAELGQNAAKTVAALQQRNEAFEAEKRHFIEETHSTNLQVRSLRAEVLRLQGLWKEKEIEAESHFAALRAKTEECDILKATVGRCSRELAQVKEEHHASHNECSQLKLELHALQDRYRTDIIDRDTLIHQLRLDLTECQRWHLEVSERLAVSQAELGLLKNSCYEMAEQLDDEKAAHRQPQFLSQRNAAVNTQSRGAHQRAAKELQQCTQRLGQLEAELEGRIRNEGTQTDDADSTESSNLETDEAPSGSSNTPASWPAGRPPRYVSTGTSGDTAGMKSVTDDRQQLLHQIEQLTNERKEMMLKAQQDAAAKEGQLAAMKQVHEALLQRYEQLMADIQYREPPAVSIQTVPLGLQCTCPSSSLEAQLDKIQGKLERVTNELRQQRTSPQRPSPIPVITPRNWHSTQRSASLSSAAHLQADLLSPEQRRLEIRRLQLQLQDSDWSFTDSSSESSQGALSTPHLSHP